MKKYFVFILLFSGLLIAQSNKNNNPIFYSAPIGEDTLNNYFLSASYYSISDNINNPNSSVFVNRNPSNEEIIKFARELPSYYFTIRKDSVAINMIMPLVKIEGKKSIYSFFILNIKTGEKAEIPCNTKGDVTEYRAAELISQYPNASKKLKSGGNSMILFNNIAYSIQYYKELKKELIENIEKYKLYDPEVKVSDLK